MNYSTTTALESKLIPGLVFTIRKRSQKRRIEFNRANAKILADINDASWRTQPLQKEAEDAEAEAKLEPCSCAGHEHKPLEIPEGSVVKAADVEHLCDYPGCQCHRAKYREGLIKELTDARNDYFELRRDQFYPALIQSAVTGIDGGDNLIDNAPITTANVFELPEEVIDEIGNEIDRLGSLSAEEKLGFPLLGTSNELAVGTIQTLTAVSVG